MLIKISTDILRDVFDWFSPKDRTQFALKFNKVHDREFSDICQKWLHEWIKDVCLGGLEIDTEDDGKSARLRSQASGTVPFAEVEMPDNINDFEGILINYLDTTVLNFLRQLQPLFRDVNLNVYFDGESLEATRTALTHLMPLFTGGIEYIRLNCSYNSTQLLPTVRDNFQAQYLGIQILVTNAEAGMNEFFELYLPWLNTRRADGQPRMLAIYFDHASILEFIDRIRQNFLETTSSPVSFFISFSSTHVYSNSISNIPESITRNGSGEQLVIGKLEVMPMLEYLLIGRCPAEVDGQIWIEEMDRKLERKLEVANEGEKRTISITYPTIGQIEEAQQQMDGNEIEENGEAEEVADQQPGPSNRF